jgi:hypothetical protein
MDAGFSQNFSLYGTFPYVCALYTKIELKHGVKESYLKCGLVRIFGKAGCTGNLLKAKSAHSSDKA